MFLTEHYIDWPILLPITDILVLVYMLVILSNVIRIVLQNTVQKKIFGVIYNHEIYFEGYCFSSLL